MRRLFCALSISFAAFTLAAANCSFTIGASDAGWYNASGYHDPANLNYLAGYRGSSGTELRDWFVFNLPALDKGAVGAELRLFTFDIRSTNGSATLELHHVATPITTLTGGGAGLVDVFDDLADGPVYATRVFSASEHDSFVSIPLNASALAAITAASGQRFAMGGRLSSIPGGTNDHSLFGFSSGSATYVQLTIFLSSTNAPAFLALPPTNYFTTSGSTARLTVDACGAFPLRYRWFFNGAFVPNQTNAALTIPNVNATNAGDYFVVVTNSLGAATSTVSHVFVDARPPVITALTYNSEVSIGDEIQITPQLDGSPFPAVQWLFEGANIPGATNYLLSITNAQFMNAGTYTLQLSNIYGVASASLMISVVPFVIYGPFDNEFDLGADGYLPVNISSLAFSTYQWRFNGTNIAGANGNVLSLFSVSNANNGYYDVIIANSLGTRTSALARVTVAGSAPHVNSTAANGYSAIGADMILETSISGSRPMTLQWYFNGVSLLNATNSQLILPNLATNMSGFYFLAASNAFGASTGSIVSLIVVGQPPAASGTLPQQTLYTGESFRLAAFAGGGPATTAQWRLNGANIPGATNSTLLLTNVTLAQAGTYQVNAGNSFGNSLSVISVTTVLPRRALDHWTWRNPRPQANDLEHIAFGNGRYVAAGEGGSIVTSTNAVDWTPVTLGNGYSTIALAFGNGTFAALLERRGSFSLLLTSIDGVNWTPRDIPFIDNGFGLGFVNGEFLVSGYGAGNRILFAASTDAVTWQKRIIAGPQAPLQSVAYGNGVYVGLHYYELLSSTDGMHWIPRVQGFRQVRFLNGIFIATGYTGQLWTSSDGVRWFARNSGTIADRLGGVAFGNGRFVVPGDDGTLLTSSDGANWSAVDSGTSKSLKAVLFDGTQFVICGNEGVLLTSPNGTSWTDWRGGRKKDLYGIVYTNGLFVAVGYEGTILTSSDGANWTTRTSPNSRDLHAITYAGGQFVAVGRTGTVLTSPNGINWISRSTPTTNYLERVTYGNGRYVAVGSAATILSSTNGIDWELHMNTAPATTELEGVTFGHGNVFVAVGGYSDNIAHSVFLVSTNGTDWLDASYSFDAGKIMRGVTFAADYFYAVGNDGVVIFSNTGLYWDSQDSVGHVPPFQNLRNIKYAAGRFVAVGNEGTVISLRSLWTQHASIVSENLHDVAYGAGKFVAVGNAGTIVQSDDALPVFSAPSVSDGTLHFNLRGGIESQYRVESSVNLFSWTNRAVFTNENGTAMPFADNTNGSRRFYRAVYP